MASNKMTQTSLHIMLERNQNEYQIKDDLLVGL